MDLMGRNLCYLLAGLNCQWVPTAFHPTQAADFLEQSIIMKPDFKQVDVVRCIFG